MIETILLQIPTGGLSETLRAVRGRFQEGGSFPVILLLMATGLSIFWIANLLAQRQRRVRATTLPPDPGRLFSDLMSRLGMTPQQRKALEHVARDLRLANPAVILISETLFDRGLERYRAARLSDQPESSDPTALMTEIRATLFPAA